MAKQLEVDASAEEIMDAYLPSEYRKCYQDLPVEQCTATPPSHIGRKVKDILQSPTNTVSTVASSVVSSLTPPFVGDDIMMSSFSMNPLSEALSVPFPREAWSAPRRASLVHAGELRRGSSGRGKFVVLAIFCRGFFCDNFHQLT